MAYFANKPFTTCKVLPQGKMETDRERSYKTEKWLCSGGLNVELMKSAPNVLLEILVTSFNKCLKNDELT